MKHTKPYKISPAAKAYDAQKKDTTTEQLRQDASFFIGVVRL
jgi:hypothetical protein